MFQGCRNREIRQVELSAVRQIIPSVRHCITEIHGIVDDKELTSMFRLLGVILSTNFPFCLKLGYDVGVVPKCERVPEPVFLSVRCIFCSCSRGAPSKKRQTAMRSIPTRKLGNRDRFSISFRTDIHNFLLRFSKVMVNSRLHSMMQILHSLSIATVSRSGRFDRCYYAWAIESQPKNSERTCPE